MRSGGPASRFNPWGGQSHVNVILRRSLVVSTGIFAVTVSGRLNGSFNFNFYIRFCRDGSGFVKQVGTVTNTRHEAPKPQAHEASKPQA